MAYEVHNFQSGAKLYANQLNEMDKQIAIVDDFAHGIYHTTTVDVQHALLTIASTQNGYYYNKGYVGKTIAEAKLTNSSSVCTPNPIDVSEYSGCTIKVVMSTVGVWHTSSNAAAPFVDRNGIIIEAKVEKDTILQDAESGKYIGIYPIPSGAVGWYISYTSGDVIESITVYGKTTRTTKPDKSKARNEVDIEINPLTNRYEDYYYQVGQKGIKYSEAKAGNGNFYYAKEPIDVSKYVGCNVRIYLSEYTGQTSGNAVMLVTDANGTVLNAGTREKDLFQLDPDTGLYVGGQDIIEGAVGLVWSLKKTDVIHSIKITGTISATSDDVKGTAYVSVNGNDLNSGTYDKPFATVTAALNAGYRDIRIMGGVYTQQIDLRGVSDNNAKVKISSVENNGVVEFQPPKNIVKITNATAVADHNNIYSATISTNIMAAEYFIFEDGIADPMTEITYAERHPNQRGYFHRCPDHTVIRKCTKTTKDEALAEIDACTDGWRWFVDGTTLYFSAPSAPSAANPIVYGHTEACPLFIINNTYVQLPNDNPAHKLSLEMIGINTRFMLINPQCMDTVKLVSCRAICSPGYHGYSFSKTSYTECMHCEAGSNNQDGFGAQNLNTTTDNKFAHNSYLQLIDCWSHDNYDDGYSEHCRSEAMLIGGLYEWNGKGGVTPSYGEVCTCINVYSRHNYQGFALVGPVDYQGQTSGRNGSTLICYNCVSESNNRGTFMKGYVINSAKNKGILIGCKAINEVSAYCSSSPEESDNAYVRLVDCTAVGCRNVFYTQGNPTIEVVNSALVTQP